MFNPNYILTYTLFFIIMLVASYSKFWCKHISPLFNNFFFRDDLRNPLLPAQHSILTHDELQMEKYLNSLKDVNAEFYQIDVSTFESGIYYIKLETKEGFLVKKIIKIILNFFYRKFQ